MIKKIIFLSIVLFACFKFFRTKKKDENTQKVLIETKIEKSRKKLKEAKPILQKNLSESESRPEIKNIVNNSANEYEHEKESIPPIQQKEDHVKFNDKGEAYITNAFVHDDMVIAHGDLIIGGKELKKAIKDGKQVLTLPPPKVWDTGIIPYQIDSKIPDKQAKKIKSVFNQIQEIIPIKFIPFEGKGTHPDYVFIKKTSSNCYSTLGKIGGKQLMGLSEKCSHREIRHETMHLLGFLHEQNRVDRDEHVIVLWENIAREHHLQFKKISNKFLDLGKFPFDLKSIMLYPSDSFTIAPDLQSIITIDGDLINTTFDLSKLDKKKLKSLYQNL